MICPFDKKEFTNPKSFSNHYRWCAGLMENSLIRLGGFTLKESTKKKIGKANTGENNGMWKGEKVGYEALHNWVVRKLGHPDLCNRCKTTAARRFDWANKSGTYKREVSDWERLCRKCHMIVDGRLEKLNGN